MADSEFLDGIMSSADQIRANHEKYKDKYVESGSNGIDSETFLKLLVAEMSNQDPLEPTSNTEFISQLAQFSAMGYMQEAGKYAQANYASSLVGKTVSVSKVDGKDVVIKTGVVSKVTPNTKNNSYTVTVDGEDFDLSKVTAVLDPNTSTDLVGSSVMADRIAQAASMVGMYATVKTGEGEDGSDIVKEGFIGSVVVKDSEIKVMIDDVAYDIADIKELTIAIPVDNPDAGQEKPGDNEGTGGTTGSEGAGGTTGSEGAGGVTGSESAGGSTESGESGSTNDVTENNEAASAANFVTGAEDVPDLPDNEEEMAEQLRAIIDSMSR